MLDSFSGGKFEVLFSRGGVRKRRLRQLWEVPRCAALTIPCRLERNAVKSNDLLKLYLGLETRLRQFKEVLQFRFSRFRMTFSIK